MSEENGAICSKCGNATTGKIYKSYWCSDCYFQKRMESFVAELRIEGLTVEQIKDLFEDSLDNILSDEYDGEILGKYGG